MGYRYSELDTRSTCPLMHKLQYVDQVPCQSNKLANVGALVHEFIALYTLHLIATSQQTDLSVLDRIADEAYDKFLSENRGLDTLNAHEFWESKLLMKQFMEENLFNPGRIVDVEHRWVLTEDLQMTTADADDAWFAGTLDLQEEIDEGHIKVTDYKTGFGQDPNPLQADVYSWATFAIYPHVERITFIYGFTRWSKESDPIEFYREDFDALDKKIRGIIADIEKGDATPTPGSGCSYCPYYDQCPYDATPYERIDNEEEARLAVEFLEHNGKFVSDTREALQEWCKENGTIKHNGISAGYHPKVSERCDEPEKFHKAVKDLGVDPWDYLDLDNRRIRKLKKKGQWPDTLKRIVRKKYTTTFGLKKAKKGEE